MTKEIINIIRNQKYHEMVGDGIDNVYKEVNNPIINQIVTKSGKYESIRNDEYVYSQGRKISNIIFNEFMRVGTNR